MRGCVGAQPSKGAVRDQAPLMVGGIPHSQAVWYCEPGENIRVMALGQGLASYLTLGDNPRCPRLHRLGVSNFLLRKTSERHAWGAEFFETCLRLETRSR